jgi:hypothetical protein
VSSARSESPPAREILGVLAILRGAKERLDAQQRPPAPVLQFIPT